MTRRRIKLVEDPDRRRSCGGRRAEDGKRGNSIKPRSRSHAIGGRRRRRTGARGERIMTPPKGKLRAETAKRRKEEDMYQ